VAYLILGCGYTGERVARALAARGEHVLATTRHPDRLSSLSKAGVVVHVLDLPDRAEAIREAVLEDVDTPVRVLHSIPPYAGPDGALLDPTPALLEVLRGRAERIVYLSTTSVYGSASKVDEHTPVDARSRRETVRVEAEQAVAVSGIPSCSLRCAAIYGPDRGFHISMLRGIAELTEDGGSYVSRIHVEDLAAISVAALDGRVEGAWPVADSEPCTQREMAEFCAQMLGVPMPKSVARSEATPTRRGNRQVDGSSILRELGLTLRYPTYREGLTRVLAELREARKASV
jgi:nucleoside-diphosphate-sugar epimerase